MRRAHIAAKRKAEKAPKYTQAECQEKLRQWVEKAPIPPIQKKTLTNISKVIVFFLNSTLKYKFSDCIDLKYYVYKTLGFILI